MKRLCLVLLVVILVLCTGCAKQWSDETGHILRQDIKPGDFAFLFDEWAYEPGMSDKEIGLGLLSALRKNEVKPDDIFDALGLPFSTTEDHGVIHYIYIFGEELDAVEIRYFLEKDEIDFLPSIESVTDEVDVENVLLIWSSGARTTDTERYKMKKRFDIGERELSFIDEDTITEEVQRAFGAPHYYIESKETGIESTSGNAIVYELTNDKVFKIIYFRQGYILRAWIEDEDGKELDVLIDRDSLTYYDEIGFP